MSSSNSFIHRKHGNKSASENHETKPSQANERDSTQWSSRIIYLVAFLDLFAVSMLSPLIRQQSLDMGSSFTTAGLMGSVYGIFQLFSSPIVGSWSDRVGRNRILLVTCLLSGLGYLLLSLSFWLPLLFLSRILCGCFKHTQTLCKAYLADIQTVEEAKAKEKGTPTSGSHFGHFMTVSTAGFVLGPIVGGHIAEQDNGFQMVALLTAVTFFTIASLVATCLPVVHVETVRVKHKDTRHGGGRFVQILYENWDVFLLQLLISFSVMVLRTNYTQHVKQHFGVTAKWAGYLTSWQALLGVLGAAATSSPLLMSFYRNNRRLMLHSCVATGAGLLASVSTAHLGLYILSLSVVNLAAPFSRLAHMNQLVTRSAHPQHHGALMGASQSVGSLCRLSSSFISGLAQDYAAYGPEVLSVVCTVLGVVQILVMY